MLVFPALMKKFSGMQLVGMGAAVGIVGYIINFFAGSNMVLLVIGLPAGRNFGAAHILYEGSD